MVGAGIHSGDLIVVDRAVAAQHKRVIVAVLDGELIVRRLHEGGGQITLLAENVDYDPIIITEQAAFEIWGTVTNVIHEVR